jgi:hypothetical protein
MNVGEAYQSDLNMNAYKIGNVGDPVNDKDAVHKRYVEGNTAQQ